MPSSRAPDNDSLGLLLDTICNSFGAVVFLALLIAIMVTQTPNSHKAELNRRRAEVRLQLSRAERELAELEEQSRDQREFLDGIQQQATELVKQVRELTAEKNRLTTVSDEVDAMRAELQSAMRRRLKTRVALDAELKKRTATAPVSRVRPTSKMEVALMLRYDRMYVWHRYSPRGDRLGLNVDEFVVLGETQAYVETAPRPDAGTPVRGSGAEAAVRRSGTCQPV